MTVAADADRRADPAEKGRMLYHLALAFGGDIPGVNVFRYLTFRTGMAVLLALFLVFMFGPRLITMLRVRQGKGQPIREDGPESHFAKRGTPTMGGLMILSSVLITTLLLANLANPFVWTLLFVLIGYGTIGFYDDYLKVTKQSAAGFSGKVRLALEFVIAVIAVWVFTRMGPPELAGKLAVPFFKDVLIDLGWLYYVFGAIVIVGTANAVNLTDGLDGLAIVPVMIASASFALIVYLVGNRVFADYLQIHYVPGVGEMAIIAGAIVGAGLGFLWYNAPPAQIFMGDTGSLALGGALGAFAVAARHELVLAIIGGLFVLEAVSVIVQVVSFKLTGKRVFRMAPLHHHFEKKGWKEETIVIRFWIIAVVLALIGLATLKLR